MIQRMIVVGCDGQNDDTGCPESTDASGWTVAEARLYAKAEGWIKVKGRDMCPKCQEVYNRLTESGVCPATATYEQVRAARNQS